VSDGERYTGGQGEDPGDVPGTRSIELDHPPSSRRKMRNHPSIRSLVDQLHDEGKHVALQGTDRRHDVTVWVAKHRWQLIVPTIAGMIGGTWYLVARRRRKKG